MEKNEGLHKHGNKFDKLMKVLQLDVIYECFFTDICFVLLPIFVSLFIQYIITNKFDFSALSPLLSFATIVLFGMATTKLIEIKVKYQKIYQIKYYWGTKYFILLIIFSVIILCIVLLREKGIAISYDKLYIFQLVLFVASIISVFLTNAEIENYLEKKETFPRNFIDMLIEADNELIYWNNKFRNEDMKGNKLEENILYNIKLLFNRVEGGILDLKPVIEEYIKENLNENK